ACRLLRLPPILGYLVVGVAVGPHAFGWVPDNAGVRDLAEFGIVFLMFSIGLEFSLPQMKTMRRAVFGLGLAQVAITTAFAMLGLYLLGYGWLAGITLGGALAMSSTAIALAVILVVGQYPTRAWFHLIARQRSPELFMLNVLLVTLGLASLTELAGLSFALGAFLAGMLIAETEYRYQVEEDIKPFRDVLLGLFFVTVGMYLDLRVVGAHLGWVALLLVGPVLAKLILIVVLARAFGAPLGAALRTGFYLAQAGEFAIVLLALASDLD